MTDRSVIVKKVNGEGGFTWPLLAAIDPDQLTARFPNNELFIVASEAEARALVGTANDLSLGFGRSAAFLRLKHMVLVYSLHPDRELV
jgi:hypothetical protein